MASILIGVAGEVVVNLHTHHATSASARTTARSLAKQGHGSTSPKSLASSRAWERQASAIASQWGVPTTAKSAARRRQQRTDASRNVWWTARKWIASKVASEVI